MHQKNFEFLQKIPQNPLPLYLLGPQIQGFNYFPSSSKFYFQHENFNIENNLFYYSQSLQNFSHFNFEKSHCSNSSSFLHPSLLTPNPLITRDFFSQQFFSSPGFHHFPSEGEQKKVNIRDSPDISSKDIIYKKLKLEDLSDQNCIKTEFKQENHTVDFHNKIKQEEERLPQVQPLSLLPEDNHSTKPVRSPPRNKWKNIPGHIMFAIKRGCKRCKENPEGPQINSIKQKWDSLPEEPKCKFWTFIQKYNRSWKTWSSIIQFISKEADQETTQILIDLISELLSSKHKESFETWLSQTKISDETREAIKLGKKVFREEFIERILQTQK